MPPGRSPDYQVWRACERFKMLPPGIEPKWEDNDWWNQQLLLAYDQGRRIEGFEETMVKQ